MSCSSRKEDKNIVSFFSLFPLNCVSANHSTFRNSYTARQKGSACWRGATKGNFVVTNGFPPLPIARAEITYVIPAYFSIQLKRGNSNLELNRGRKLLNTEKLMFNADKVELLSDWGGGTYVLVSVEPEGVVAIPQAKERDYVIYNIVCDELFLGIPRDAWYVVALVLLCLGFALVLPRSLPPYLLPKNQASRVAFEAVSKDP